MIYLAHLDFCLPALGALWETALSRGSKSRSGRQRTFFQEMLPEILQVKPSVSLTLETQLFEMKGTVTSTESRLFFFFFFS